MSHYARLVEPLTVSVASTGAKMALGIDTEIKRVRLVDGVYHFDARYHMHTLAQVVEGWIEVSTEEDLPAFTDKGRAHRERDVQPTLKPGRPVGGGAPTERAIAFRPTTAQREWLMKRAKKSKTTLSGLVRDALHSLGMPR